MIFSAFHFQFQTFLPRLFMGILLGYLLIWSGSIIISMIAHFLHNFLTLVIAKYNESSNIPELEETNYIALMISIMVLSSLSYLYYNNYKKNNSALIE